MRKELVLLVHLFAVTVSAQAPPCPSESAIFISKGIYEAMPGVQYRLADFRAKLIPKGKTAPLCYERTTLVSTAQIFISSESLTRVFAKKLQLSHSQISDFAVHHDSEGATLSGSIKKVIPIHFSIRGPVSTDGNSIRMDAKSVKADGIPIKDLLKLVGAELNTLIPIKGMRGIEVGQDNLSFSPEAVANLKGHISSVKTSNEGLILRYTPAHRQAN